MGKPALASTCDDALFPQVTTSAGKPSVVEANLGKPAPKKYKGLEVEIDLELQKEKNTSSPRAKRTAESFSALADALFEEFYAAYPRKAARGDAEKAWKKIAPTDREMVVERAIAFRKHTEINRIEKQYIAYPATWLNGKRWDDELVAATPSSSRRHVAYQDPTDLSEYLEDL